MVGAGRGVGWWRWWWGRWWGVCREGGRAGVSGCEVCVRRECDRLFLQSAAKSLPEGHSCHRHVCQWPGAGLLVSIGLIFIRHALDVERQVGNHPHTELACRKAGYTPRWSRKRLPRQRHSIFSCPGPPFLFLPHTPHTTEESPNCPKS